MLNSWEHKKTNAHMEKSKENPALQTAAKNQKGK